MALRGIRKVPSFKLRGGVRDKCGEICSGFCYAEGDRIRICLCEEDVRGVWLWKEDKVGREREEVLESEGKRVFESWKRSLEEVLGGIREVVEENTFEWKAT